MAILTMEMYKTKDLGEAAALIAMGHELRTIERQGNICYFTFDKTAELVQDSHSYYFGALMVNAREFHEATGRLKNRIFAY